MKIAGQPSSSTIVARFGEAELGDQRLGERAARMAAALEADPAQSFPKSFGTIAALEGGYRFFNNQRVTPLALLEPHFRATAERARGQELVRLIHDTTVVDYSGEIRRFGLGRLHGRKSQGFFAHTTLAVGDGEARAPLGPLGLKTWVRKPKPKRKPKARRSIRGGRTDGESLRWAEQARGAAERLGDQRVVHIMDREADSYALFCALGSSGFVIRSAHNRVIELPEEEALEVKDKLRKAAAEAPIVFEREVRLSRRLPGRNPKERKEHPARESRLARLGASALSVRIRRTEYVSAELPEYLGLNLIRVIELDAPIGASPIEWLLLTNLPATTPEEIAAVIDHYRTRWLIEEFFKALKSGCKLEERRLEEFHGLTNVLAMFIPIACQMLELRYLSRHEPDQPAAKVLSPTQLDVLKAQPHLRLPRRPSIRDALHAVARLGGHLPQNGEPGWSVIARGMYDLRLLEIGWHSARRRCDQ